MKHLLGLEDLRKEEILEILDLARHLKEWWATDYKARRQPLTDLKGKRICLLFYEPSTRTRYSFEVAGRLLGGETVAFSPSLSSIRKGESFKDTLLTLESLGFDLFVIRHPYSGACFYASQVLKRASVVNAGDGLHEHPTQTLLDLLTIYQARGTVEGLKIAIIGDILHSRVARSHISALSKLNWEVRLCAPPTLLPKGWENWRVKVYYDMKKAIEGVDVVYMLRIQRERQEEQFFPSLEEYSRFFGLNEDLLSSLKVDCMVMHPGPVNRGVEIWGEVVDGERSFILSQVENGIAVRMAVMKTILGGKG